MSARRPRGVIRTAVALVLLALMLFPVYWMLNISLQPNGNTLAGTFFPTDPTLAGYRTALEDQGRNLVTSLLIASGTVVVTLLIAAPVRLRPGPVPVPLDQLGPARHPDLPDDPGHRDRQRPLHAVRTARPAQLRPRPDRRQRRQRDPVRDPDPALVHARRAALDRGGGPGRRRRPGPVVRLHRGADQPELVDHRRAVRVPLRLERLHLRADADHAGRRSCRSRSASTPTSAPTSTTGAR